MCRVNEISSEPKSETFFKKIIESKWTDAALVVTAIALSIIAVLAYKGVFNHSMGVVPASRFCFGLILATVLLVVLEGAKLCRPRERPVNNQIEKPQPLSAQELELIFEKVKGVAKERKDVYVVTAEGIFNVVSSADFKKDPIGHLSFLENVYRMKSMEEGTKVCEILMPIVKEFLASRQSQVK